MLTESDGHLDSAGEPFAGVASDQGPDPLREAGVVLSLVRELVVHHTDLFCAELRKAGIGLSVMLALALVLPALAFGAWGTLCAAITVALWDAGLSLAASLGAVAALNVGAALVVVFSIGRVSRYLRFPATCRSLAATRERVHVASDSVA